MGFLSDYDDHVKERETDFDVPIAPKPLDAGQVSEIIEEVKVRHTSLLVTDEVGCWNYHI